MIDVNDNAAKAGVKLHHQSGKLFMVGPTFRKNGKDWNNFVLVDESGLDAAWDKLVKLENERTAYIDGILSAAREQ